MKHFKIGNPFKKLRLMFKEIDNYYFFIRQAEMLADNGELKHHKLKISDKHNIFGAINMPPELLLYNKGEELDRLEKQYFGSEMSKLNEIFIKYGLIELYHIDFERVKDDDYYAYVFNIRYNWEHVNRTSVITSISVAAAMLGALVYGILQII